MSEVKIMLPNNVANDFNKMTVDDMKMLMALYYYNAYRKSERSLEDIADRICISVYELVDIYGKMDLPLIIGNVDDYEDELKELERAL